MGQSINVLMYGVRVPDGIDIEEIVEQWDESVADEIKAHEAKLRTQTNYSWGLAVQALVPKRPRPDDAEPDDLVGYYVCDGYYDSAESHRFPDAASDKKRLALQRCKRQWSRFAKWAKERGVKFDRPKIWHTRTEVA